MTQTKLFRGAGVAAVAAGVLFVLLQLIHPDETIPDVTTATWKVVHVMTLAMLVLAVIGILGMYLREVEESGLLGFIAAVLYGCGFFIIFWFAFVEAAVLPQLAGTEPRYVQDVMALTAGSDVIGPIGGLAVANVGSAVTYLLGGVLFGVALWRARVLWRWTSALLAIGALSTILIQVLPKSLDRIPAIPVGVAWTALGISLRRSTSPSGARRLNAIREPQDASVGTG
jgi:hypothetical protein